MLYLGAISIDIASKLIPNMLTIAVQLCSTLFLFLAFKKYLYKPVKVYIDNRNALEQSRLEKADVALQRAELLESKRQEQFKEASIRTQEIIEAGKNEADQIKAQIIEAGEKEITYKTKKAEEQLESQIRQAKDQIRDEMVSVAMLVSEKLLQDQFNEETDMKRIEELVQELAK